MATVKKEAPPAKIGAHLKKVTTNLTLNSKDFKSQALSLKDRLAEFLRFFDSRGKFAFQGITKNVSNESVLRSHFFGGIEKYDLLKEWAEDGSLVCFLPNRDMFSDPNPEGIQIAHINACWVKTNTLDKINRSSVQPSVILSCPDNSFCVFWKVVGLEATHFKGIQRKLVDLFDGDVSTEVNGKTLLDPSRSLPLPIINQGHEVLRYVGRAPVEFEVIERICLNERENKSPRESDVETRKLEKEMPPKKSEGADALQKLAPRPNDNQSVTDSPCESKCSENPPKIFTATPLENLDLPIKSSPPSFCPDTAKKFLSLFGRKHTFQTFDDAKPKREGLAQQFHGTLEEHFGELHRLAQNGAGIFFTVNETNGSGRKATNIIRVRAIFVDLDGSPVAPVLNAPLEPIVINTSPNKYHAYWLVKDFKLEAFTPVQQSLIKRFSSDNVVKDLPRVMRIPGSVHQKGEPFQTEIHHWPHNIVYHTQGEVFKAFKIDLKANPEKTKTKQTVPNLTAAAPKRETETFKALQKANMIVGAGEKPGSHKVVCPFGSPHSDDRTFYFEPETEGYEKEGFKCFHESCKGKAVNDLRKHLGIKPTRIQANSVQKRREIIAPSLTPPKCLIDKYPPRMAAAAKEMAAADKLALKMASESLFSARSMTLGKQIRIFEKYHHWHFPCFFIVIINPPSERKSRAYSRAFTPIFEAEEEHEKIYGDKRIIYNIEREIFENTKKGLLKEIKKTKDTKKQNDLRLKLKSEEARLKTMNPPHYQAFSDDFTEAALFESMEEHGGRFAVASADGENVLSYLLGKSGEDGAPKYHLVLKGLTKDRMTRNRKGVDGKSQKQAINNPALNVVIFAQPEPARRFLNDQRVRESGLYSRTTIVTCPKMAGTRFEKKNEEEVDLSNLIENNEITKELHLKNYMHSPSKFIKITLSKDAKEARRLFFNNFEGTIGENGENEDITDLVGKMTSRAVQRAGVFQHDKDYEKIRDKEPGEIEISEETFLQAAEIEKQNLEIAASETRTTEEDLIYQAAAEISKKLSNPDSNLKKMGTFTHKNFQNAFSRKSKVNGKPAAGAILKVLTDHNHLKKDHSSDSYTFV